MGPMRHDRRIDRVQIAFVIIGIWPPCHVYRKLCKYSIGDYLRGCGRSGPPEVAVSRIVEDTWTIYLHSKMASTSTATFRGKAAQPTATRA
jgi:hypothetical protein